MAALLADIQKWNRQGFIPGVDETEEEFVKRVHFCQELKHALFSGESFPFEETDQASQEILQTVLPKTESLYDIAPTWVPLFFSNYQLAPWHGGCAWIFQLREDTPMAAFLQLRAQFRNTSSYLGIYKREELIAHELAHVGRMMYREPQFEEILAYQSASSAWRCWLGPIVQSSRETLFFILVLGAVFLAQMALVNLERFSFFSPFMLGLMLIPVFLFILGLSRLIIRQWQFHRCLKNLKSIYREEKIARAVIYRLLDREIHSFAFSSPQQICDSMAHLAARSFRWHFILQNYPYFF